MNKTYTPELLSPSGKIRRLRLFEYTLYAIILLAALGIPFFTDVYKNFGWERVLREWLRILPFVLIFAVNNFIFVPKLLFREKYLYYFLTCILSVVMVIYLSNFMLELSIPKPPNFENVNSIDMQRGRAPRELPPFESANDMNMQNRRMPRELQPSEDANEMNIQPRRTSPPSQFRNPRPQFGFAARNQILHFVNFWLSIVALLLIGFNAGIKSFVRWSEEKIRQSEKDRLYFYNELAFLKHQISPHFFMNTLNNIHALVDINAERAKDTIIKLSNLMRYLLYESDIQKVLLKKEIDFIESYIELMRLRYDEDNVTIETEYPENVENVYVPSSLFLSFIENAFKHGINPHNHSSIKIGFSVDSGLLTFSIVNSRWNTTAYQTETSGIGLENVRKRLNLIYKNNYTLDINLLDNTFNVILKIPII